MIKIHRKISIHAPVDKVFDFMDDPHNLPEVWPSMVEVRNVTPAPAGGYNFDWVYKMAGIRIDGTTETIEHAPNERIVTQSKKGIDSKFTWKYRYEGNITEITVDTEYNIPIPLIGKLAEALIVKQNEHEADTLLDNLKNRMEIVTPIPA